MLVCEILRKKEAWLCIDFHMPKSLIQSVAQQTCNIAFANKYIDSPNILSKSNNVHTHIRIKEQIFSLFGWSFSIQSCSWLWQRKMQTVIEWNTILYAIGFSKLLVQSIVPNKIYTFVLHSRVSTERGAIKIHPKQFTLKCPQRE